MSLKALFMKCIECIAPKIPEGYTAKVVHGRMIMYMPPKGQEDKPVFIVSAGRTPF